MRTVTRKSATCRSNGNTRAWANRGAEPCVIANVLIEGVTRRDAPMDERQGIPKRP